MKSWICLAVLIVSVGVGRTEDWPQWLGPNRDGSSPTVIAPWKGDLKVLWRRPIGEGNSSPVVAGGVVYLTAKVAGKNAESVHAFDAVTGEPKWEKSYERPAFKPQFGEGPRATAVVQGDAVVTLGNTGILNCWDAKSGAHRWAAETLTKPVDDNLVFGVSASPLIRDGLVVVQRGRQGSRGISAYKLADGKLAWTAGEDAASYAAPRWMDNEFVVLTEAHLLAVSPQGRVTWKTPFKDLLNESSSTPIRVGDIYIAASVTAGAIGVKVVRGSDATDKVEKVWANPKLTCYFSTPVPVGTKHAYLVTGSIVNPSVVLRCIDTTTGKEIWNHPKVGKYHAALLTLGDGKVLMHQDSGELILLAPNVEKYEELARSSACKETWAHPAIADGKIYLRDTKELICISLK